MVKREDGIVWIPIMIGLAIVASLGLVIGAITTSNEPNSDHPLTVKYGCQGGLEQCSAAPVPEPASGLLIAVGGLTVAYCIRRKY